MTPVQTNFESQIDVGLPQKNEDEKHFLSSKFSSRVIETSHDNPGHHIHRKDVQDVVHLWFCCKLDSHNDHHARSGKGMTGQC